VIEIRHSILGYNPVETAICGATEHFSPEGHTVLEAMLAKELGPQTISNNEWDGE
jgi:hypothetical protein